MAGCLEGECHFIEGNLRARKRINYVKAALQDAGMDPERVEMFNLSSAMGPRFAEIAQEMTERIQNLGPSPLRRSRLPNYEPGAPAQPLNQTTGGTP